MSENSGEGPKISRRSLILGGLGAIGVYLAGRTKAVEKVADKLAGEVAKVDNKDLAASSGGAEAQKLSAGMTVRNQTDDAKQAQKANDQAEAEALRQKLNPNPQIANK